MKARAIVAVVLLACVAGRATTTKVELGGLTLEVSDSRTAQVFHIVDQLSQWDQYAHKQYVRWAAKSLTLDEQDQELLKKHAEMRRQRGWGNGFEQAFLVDDSIEDAARKAQEKGLLKPDEAAQEREILLHFAPKLQPLLEQQRPQIEALERELAEQQPKLAPTVAGLVHFAEIKSAVTVLVFLVANPENQSGGGEANGGRLVVEVPGPNSLGALLHESLHALLRPHKDAIAAAAKGAGMDFEVLNEGIAYALYPGLVDNSPGRDRLAEQFVRYQLQGIPPTNSYMRFWMLALVLRPLLREALARGETITAFLPQAVQEWQRVAGR